jgi:nitric oxide reductase activation protein
VEGDHFDYRALLDFAVDRKTGKLPSDRLYIKRVKQQRDVAVLILVDLSRSTSSKASGANATVLDIEKQAIVLLSEALTVVGDRFAIAGFSGTGRLGVDYLRIKEFSEPMIGGLKKRINALAPQRSTRMGAAIRHAASELEKVAAAVRVMMTLGDGFPNDVGYKDAYAIADTRKAVQEAYAKHIHFKAITVNIAGDPKLDELYGHLNHNVISDIMELPDKLLSIYSAMTRM